HVRTAPREVRAGGADHLAAGGNPEADAAAGRQSRAGSSRTDRAWLLRGCRGVRSGDRGGPCDVGGAAPVRGRGARRGGERRRSVARWRVHGGAARARYLWTWTTRMTVFNGGRR